MRYWTLVSSARFRLLLLVFAALLVPQTAQAQSYWVLEQLGDGTVITRPAEVQDNLDGMDPTTHHMLFGASTRKGTAQIFWLSFEQPLVWEHGADTNEAYEMVLTARIPQGGDILYQAWSYDDNQLVDSFAHVRASDLDGWGIDQARLQALPPGNYEIQAVIRIPGRTHARAIQRLDVLGDGQVDLGIKPDGATRPEPGENDPDPDADEDRGEKPIRGENGGGGGGAEAPADHDWPLGASGFTALPLKDGGRIIYVSTSGRDRSDGLTPQTPVRTPQRGYQLLRNGRPDQLRFKAGDVFRDYIGGWSKSGQSSDAPMVIGAYGEGPRPRFDISRQLIDHSDQSNTIRYLAIQGLHIYCTTRDPRHADYDGEEAQAPKQGLYLAAPVENLLVEDCKFQFFAFAITLRAPDHQNPSRAVTIRRNIIRYCWNRSHGQSSAIYSRHVQNLLIEENLFDHNGWLPASWGVEESERDDQSHHLYLTPRPGEPGSLDFPATVRGNILSRASSHGIKGSAGGLLQDNLFFGNAIGGFMSGPNSALTRNVVLGGVDLSVERPRGWGLEVFSMDQARIEDNIIAHRDSDKDRGWAFKLSASRNVFQGNIVYNWSAPEHHDRDIEANGALVSQDNLLGSFTDDGGRYVDPDRSIGSYHATLGGEASVDAFMNVAASRPRGAWDERYTQAAVNQYIRDGFQPQAPSN